MWVYRDRGGELFHDLVRTGKGSRHASVREQVCDGVLRHVAAPFERLQATVRDNAQRSAAQPLALAAVVTSTPPAGHGLRDEAAVRLHPPGRCVTPRPIPRMCLWIRFPPHPHSVAAKRRSKRPFHPESTDEEDGWCSRSSLAARASSASPRSWTSRAPSIASRVSTELGYSHHSLVPPILRGGARAVQSKRTS